VVGMGAGIFYYFILKKQLLGRFLGALVVGLVGSFLGGVINYFFKDILANLSDVNDVNLFAALITALILLGIFSKVSTNK